MSDKFQNKYRIPTTRLQNWDYGSDALYFVTICTAHRECYFGNIVNREMVLSELGKTVDEEWLKTFELRRDMNLQMDEYVVMPNHFHAIISIGINRYNMGTVGNAVDGGDVGITDIHKNKFGPQSKNLASIIRGFKSAVTTFARINRIEFGWQPRFYEHIIRTNDSFQRISQYIASNPANWQDDQFFI